ncbi:MAG TPA: hypothetical protein EYP14_06200, partial [Planctomycetaceae bacterium]|nr:hypothetical protein [Planctomycetaceae bacterium]
GWLYAWNTVGALVGAVGTGLVLLPWLDFAGVAVAAVGTNLLLALATCVIFRKVAWKPLAGVLAGVALVTVVPPRWPEAILRMSPFLSGVQDGRIVFCKAGRSSTVLLTERDGYYTMRNNGLPEAGVARRGAPPGDWETHRWLTVLPVLARPKTASMLMIGLGGGTAAAGTPQTVQHIDVIELEPEVVAANRAIARQRARDPLDDPRVRVIVNDARSVLELTTKRYDAIVSQPSHPWTAGASHLYTREFVALARAHLNPGGVFLQWMNTSLVDKSLFRSVGATLLDVFRYVRLYRPNPEIVLFVASDQPLPVEHHLAESIDGESGQTVFEALWAASAKELQWLGINSVQDVAAALALEEDAVARLCRGAPINTDDENRLALWSPRRLLTAAEFDIDQLLARLDPIVDASSRLNNSSPFQPDRVYLARRLANRHLWARATRVAQSIREPAARWLALGLVAAKRGRSAEARRALLESLTLDSDNPNATFAYLEPMLVPLARGQADPAVAQIASSLRGPAAAVVYACRLHAQGDAKRMADLEPWLAQARPTDTFFALATTFRAYWRSRVTAPELQGVYAEQALELLDRSLATDPSLFAALLRVQAAARAGQDETLIESIAYVARLFQSQPEAASPRMIQSTVPLLLKRLDSLSLADRSLADRVAEVRGRLETLIPPADG